MQLRIAHTLSLLLVTTVLVTVFAMAGVAAWTLKNGFTDYLLGRDVERLEQFADLVSEMAGDAGGLSALLQQTSMRDLLRRFARQQGTARDRPPPPRMKQWRDDQLPGRAAPPPRAGRPDNDAMPRPHRPPPRRPPPPPDDFIARITLVNLDGQALHDRPGRRPSRQAPGAAADEYVERPITLNGTVVALARMRVSDRVPDAVETRFLRSQYMGIIGVSAALLILALAGAWWFARRWAKPLQALQSATERIARGEFDIRLRGREQGEGRTDEVGDLVRDVNRMADGLQQLESARRRWLAEISHELRTPLTTLRGEIEALLDGVRPLRTQAVVSLHEDVLRLSKLIDDLHLLAMSDLQSLPSHFEDLDAVALVRRIAERFRARAHTAGLAVKIDTGSLTAVPVAWDGSRIEQLLSNLLENSLRYTDAPGQITITLRHNTKGLVIDIEDSAPGVPKAEISRLFEPLYRADSGRSRIRGGSGLGLAICHAIVAGHAGTIDARPSWLGGLHLRIELPETPEISVASTMTHNRTKS